MRLILEEHAVRMMSVREGASQVPTTAPTVPARGAKLRGAAGTQLAPHRVRNLRSGSRNHHKQPCMSQSRTAQDQSSPPARARLPGDFGQVLPAATVWATVVCSSQTPLELSFKS